MKRIKDQASLKMKYKLEGIVDDGTNRELPYKRQRYLMPPPNKLCILNQHSPLYTIGSMENYRKPFKTIIEISDEEDSDHGVKDEFPNAADAKQERG